MHDPDTLLFTVGIPVPWRREKDYRKLGATCMSRIVFATVWHRDPCTDGTDDSCGRKLREGCPEHRDKVVARALSSLAWNWRRERHRELDDEDDGQGTLPGMTPPVRMASWEDGYFSGTGELLVQPSSLLLIVTWHLAFEDARLRGKSVEKAAAFSRRHTQDNLARLLTIAEDAGTGLRMRDSKADLTDEGKLKEHRFVYRIYRGDRPKRWWQNTAFHFHHWHIHWTLFSRM